ncbi:hypothetical protein LXA43DRAFT_270101 [Ganoderma leucocontextum]|nr:hypothetical protein LXA43DRAFT_270101 [Ganoderma leucocontextum]
MQNQRGRLSLLWEHVVVLEGWADWRHWSRLRRKRDAESASPVLQKSPMVSSPRDTRVNSLAVISLGHDGEPPMRKRRRTGSFGSSASRVPPAVSPPKEPPPSTPTLTSPSAPICEHVHQQPLRPTTPVTSQPPLPSTKPRSIAQLLSPEPPPKDPSFGNQSALKARSPSPPIPPSQLRSLLVDDSQPPRQSILATKPWTNAVAEAVVPEERVEEGEEKVEQVASAEEQAQTQAAEAEVEAVELKVMEPQVVSPTIVGKVLPPAEADPEDVPMSSAPAMQEEAVVPLVEVKVEDSPAVAGVGNLLGPTMNAAEGSTLAPTTVEESEQLARSPVTMVVEQLSLSSEAMAGAEDMLGLTTWPIAVSEAAHQSDSEPVQAAPSEPQHSKPMPEDDPHEWLLEHYASPVHSSRRSSLAPEEPPQTPDFSDAPSPPRESSEEVPKRTSSPAARPPPEPKKRPKKKAPSPSRSPTPTALLEQELDGIVPDGLAAAAPSPRSDTDTDFGLELDLAASVIPDAGTDPDISMGNDLDDELLSLVNDKPHHHSHSHSHSHSHPHTHLHSHSHSHRVATGKASHLAPSAASVERLPPPKEPVDKKPVAQSSPPVRASSPTPAPLERAVMPPPIAPPQVAKQATPQIPAKPDKPSDGTSLSVGTKKKEPTAKQPVPKPKQPPKPKAKSQPKPKVKPTKEKEGTAEPSGRLTPSGNGTVSKGKKVNATSAPSAAAAAKRAVSAATGPSRSRSASEMPVPAEPAAKPKAQPQEEEESEEEAVDDKLYCICKTNYDEDKVMIACDRCDEWYHTQCLDMDDLEVDLIDQFVCPLCIKANPNLPLQTTYKQRCTAGLKHPHPSSAAACHKPARGAFSKFCSDECGVLYMQRRIQDWGGNQEVLWASIRDTKQREGVVVKVHVLGGPNGVVADDKHADLAVNSVAQESHEVQRSTQTQRDRAIVRLQAELDKIAPKREELKQEHDGITWRQKVLELAAARADRVDECGWDQRLIFDEEEYLEFGEGVLESYEERSPQPTGAVDDPMQVDGADGHGEWWCRGKKKCQRHAGWQKLRASEIEYDLVMNRKCMQEVTNQEREIRKKLEDTMSIPLRMVMPGSFQPSNGHHSTNGIKAKPNGTSGRKGKQKH